MRQHDQRFSEPVLPTGNAMPDKKPQSSISAHRREEAHYDIPKSGYIRITGKKAAEFYSRVQVHGFKRRWL